MQNLPNSVKILNQVLIRLLCVVFGATVRSTDKNNNVGQYRAKLRKPKVCCEACKAVVVNGYFSHKCVTTRRKMPKLKLESINEAIKLNSYRGLLQEFQYGNGPQQTNT